MRLLRPFVLVLVLLTTSVASAQKDAPDASEAKYKDIRTLLTVLNVGPVMRQSLLDQIDQERSLKDSDVPPEFWDLFEKEALSSMPEFIERMIPVYDAQFTHAEIKSLIKIHQDPAMIKFSNSQEALEHASEEAGEAWGNELGLRVAAKMQNEPEQPKTKPAAKKQPAKKK